MSWAENVRIETPEQIDVDLEIAGPGSRFYAQVSDWLRKLLVLILAGTVVGFAAAGAGAAGSPLALNYLILAIGIIAAFLFIFGYDIYYEGGRNGQTPGKREAGIRVVRDGGGSIGMQEACIRNLVGLADFVPVCYLLGGLVMMLNAKGQRLGDMAAGTIVVRERPMEAHEEIDKDIMASAGAEYAFAPEQLGRCSPKDGHILQSFFCRCEGMEPRARRELAYKLRDALLARTGYVPAEPIEGVRAIEAFLAALYRDLKQQQQHS